MKEGENNLGIASVLLGIISITLSILSPLVLSAIVFAAIGLIFSVKQTNKTKWKKWGKILSIIGIILGILIIIASYVLVTNYPDLLNSLKQY